MRFWAPTACQKLGPQVPSSGSTKGGIRLRRKYKIPDHCLNRVFGHYGPLEAIDREETTQDALLETRAENNDIILLIHSRERKRVRERWREKTPVNRYK